MYRKGRPGGDIAAVVEAVRQSTQISLAMVVLVTSELAGEDVDPISNFCDAARLSIRSGTTPAAGLSFRVFGAGRQQAL